MDILEKFGIRYAQPIDQLMINTFVLQNIEKFNEPFSGLSHPLEAAYHFERLSKQFIGHEINDIETRIAAYESSIERLTTSVAQVEKEKKEYLENSFFASIFRRGRHNRQLSSFDERIVHQTKGIKTDKEKKVAEEQALVEAKKIINYWDIFHEAAMDAYAELVNANSMHQYLELESYSMMREYYLAAEGLNGVRFDMQTFLNDGLVNTVFALSDSPMDTNGCSVSTAIDKLCNIKLADHLTRKHIFTKLMGSSINVSMITHLTQLAPNNAFGATAELIA